MLQRALGDAKVSAIGYGAMPLSVDGRPGAEDAIATVHAALDAGITLIDTADAYCLSSKETGHNERLVAEALRRRVADRAGIVVATKGGHTRGGDGTWDVDGRPEYLKRACDASLRALGVDVIDLYQFHRPDPVVPFEESAGALAELLAAGKIRRAGLSNVNIEQIEAARGVVPVTSVQNRLAPSFRSSLAEVRHCEAHGIAFLAWGPLGGMSIAASVGDRHPRFAEVARRHGVSPQRVALAWELSLADVVIPIPGSSRPVTIIDSAAAVELELTDDDISLLDAD